MTGAVRQTPPFSTCGGVPHDESGMNPISYKRHRFPLDIIRLGVWCAVAKAGEVLDVLVQKRHNEDADLKCLENSSRTRVPLPKPS